MNEKRFVISSRYLKKTDKYGEEHYLRDASLMLRLVLWNKQKTILNCSNNRRRQRIATKAVTFSVFCLFRLKCTIV